MARLRLQLLAVAVGVCIAAGCDANDIGKDCPDLLGDQSPGGAAGTRVETEEVVEQDVTFPCDELICIATDGRSGYCSKRCRENAGCPAGFECRVIQKIGPFAGEMFCAWKRCATSADCGSKKEFCCVAAPSPVAGEELKLCDFKGNDTCP